MSDKRTDKLNPIDRLIRSTWQFGMNQGIQLRIERIIGFELFNTRPYHNYETWSDGYRVTVFESGENGSYEDALSFKVQAEDLDDAIKLAVETFRKRQSIVVHP